MNDYETTVMLFKLFCIAGFEALLLVYIHWSSKFMCDEDFPGVVKKKKIHSLKRFLKRILWRRQSA